MFLTCLRLPRGGLAYASRLRQMRTSVPFSTALAHGCRPEQILNLVSLDHGRRLRGTPSLVVPGDSLQFTVYRLEHHGGRQRLPLQPLESDLDLVSVILPTAEHGSGALTWVLGNRG